ncbi:MAG: hypothetical protein ABI579_08180 [Candidatus Sumerlaeota bacterium]
MQKNDSQFALIALLALTITILAMLPAFAFADDDTVVIVERPAKVKIYSSDYGFDAPSTPFQLGFIGPYQLFKYGVPVYGLRLGILSVSNIRADGLSLATLYNYQGLGSGISLAGICNISDTYMKGIAVSIIQNRAGTTMEGLQVSALLNFARMAMKGIQVTLLSNYVGGPMEGAQLCGIWNTMGSGVGVQGALIQNVAGGLVGIQAALVNRNTNQSGIQFGGANFAWENAGGLQLGAYNKTFSLHGFQIGLVNNAGSVHGAQIGILNFEGGRIRFPILNL